MPDPKTQNTTNFLVFLSISLVKAEIWIGTWEKQRKISLFLCVLILLHFIVEEGAFACGYICILFVWVCEYVCVVGLFAYLYCNSQTVFTEFFFFFFFWCAFEIPCYKCESCFSVPTSKRNITNDQQQQQTNKKSHLFTLQTTECTEFYRNKYHKCSGRSYTTHTNSHIHTL